MKLYFRAFFSWILTASILSGAVAATSSTTKDDSDRAKTEAKGADENGEDASPVAAKPASSPANKPTAKASSKVSKVYVVPMREDIMPPLTYIVRRGVKEAMDAGAEVLIIDMDTNGGMVSVMEEIVEILNKFDGETITFINSKAFSAGAFISVATQRIYMSPKGVIGAAAVIGGGGDLPPTVEAKAKSAVMAMMRTQAQRNGHNIDVLEAMIDKEKELIIDGETICDAGNLLTLTAFEAEREVGDPPKPLLSLGTYKDLDELIEALGYGDAEVTHVEALGVEKVASWLNSIGALLIVIGIGGIWIEMKAPGFGLPGTISIVAFSLYFFGSYAAGLAGLEWFVVFLLGLGFVAVEIFIFPGTMVNGLIGVFLIFVTLVMALADYYPGTPVDLSFMGQALGNAGVVLAQATVGSILMAWVFYQFVFPRMSQRYSVAGGMMSAAASGVGAEIEMRATQQSRMGQVGETISPLRPGGKARFGEDIINVISDGELIGVGAKVKVIGSSGMDAIVEAVEE